MARVAVFLDHDIVVRHFVHSGVLRCLEERHDVVYVVPREHRRVRLDVGALGLPRVREIAVSDIRAYRWRRLYHATLLRRARSSPDRDLIYDNYRNLLGRRALVRSILASLPVVHAAYTAIVRAQNGSYPELVRLLAEERVDAVVHPTVLEGLFVTDLIDWSRRTGRPLILLMNSWDNPSLKATIDRPVGWLVVWGEQTRRHAIDHMRWPPELIRTFGAAQFNVYRDPPAIDRATFLGTLGLSPSRPTLLYAGTSKGVDEVAQLEQLDCAVGTGELPDIQIIYRPHPWRGVVMGERNFREVAWRNVRMDPQMSDHYDVSRRDPAAMFMPGYAHTHVLLSSVDAVLSPLSTMLLEAALHGIPALAYVPLKDMAENFHMRNIARMSFMREFLERLDAGPVLRQEDLIPGVRALLVRAGEQGLADDLRRRSRFFAETSGPRYGQRLLTLLDEISAPTQA